MTTRTGPAHEMVFLFVACLNRGHFRPSAIARVEPDEAVIVGPIEAVIANRAGVQCENVHGSFRIAAGSIADTTSWTLTQARGQVQKAASSGTFVRDRHTAALGYTR